MGNTLKTGEIELEKNEDCSFPAAGAVLAPGEEIALTVGSIN
jgi:hypothetical protein